MTAAWTVRIARRNASADATVELYPWANGAPAARTGRTSIPAASFAPGGPLDIAAAEALFATGGTQEALDALGRALFDAVFSGALATQWHKRPSELRVFLDVGSADLARLPWESMRDSTTLPVFLDGDVRFMRWVEPAGPGPATLAEQWPIRVLVIVACSDREAAKIGADAEVNAIRRQLRPVDHTFDVDVLDARREDCNPATCRARIEEYKPHILHVIGHARVAAGSGVLELWDRSIDGGTPVPWRAADLATALRAVRRRDIRLAYLNACRTNDEAEELTAPRAVSSLAQSFFAAGIPAVLSMQGKVHGDAARQCAESFYASLASEASIDAALVAGRTYVQQLPELGTDGRHPFVPVLAVQRDPDQILVYRALRLADEDAALLQSCETLRPVRARFVNQVRLRRDIVATFFGTGIERRTAAVFQGQRDSGKTWLAAWLLAAWAFRGHRVLYLEARYHPNWLEMMRKAVTQGASGHYVRRPLPPEAQDRFFSVLNAVARGLPPPAVVPRGVVDETAAQTQAILKDNEAVPRIMAGFLQALKDAAGDGELLLVFDHLHATGDHAVAESTVNDLKAYLWDVIAQDPKSPVKVLVVLPPANPDANVDTEPYPEAYWKRVPLRRIPAADVRDVLPEYYRLRYQEEPTAPEQEFLTNAANPLLAGELPSACEIARLMLHSGAP